MDAYLKESYKNSKLSTWRSVTVVLGNESSDLDSVASTLTFAYFLHKQSKGGEDTVLPVINTSRHLFRLRKDVVFVLNSTFGFDLEPSLIFYDDLDLSSNYQHGQLKLVLVDHSILATDQTYLSPIIVQIVDHHYSLNHDTVWPSQSANRIEQVGSCCTLIAEIMDETDSLLLQEKSVSLLLFAAILVDTNNFDLNSGKTTPKDTDIGRKLKENFLVDVDVNTDSLYDSIVSMRRDTSAFSVSDLLYKDFKGITNNQISIGTSTVLTSISKFLLKSVNITKDLEDFSSNKKIDILVILFVYQETGEYIKNTRRQIAVFSKNEIYRNQVLDCLLADDRLAELSLDKFPEIAPDIAAFEQKNVSMGRKQILPVLETFLRGLAKNSADSFSPSFAESTTKVENPKSSARRFVETHGLAKSFSVTYDDSLNQSQEISPESETENSQSTIVSPTYFTDSVVREGKKEFQEDIDYATNDKPSESMLQEFVSGAIENSQFQLETEDDQHMFNTFLDSTMVDVSEEAIAVGYDRTNAERITSLPNGASPSSELAEAETPKTPPNTFVQPFGIYMDENLLSPAKFKQALSQTAADNQGTSCPPTPPNSFINTPKLSHEPHRTFEAQDVENQLRKLSESIQLNDDPNSTLPSPIQNVQLSDRKVALENPDNPSASSSFDVKVGGTGYSLQYSIPQVQFSDSESEFAGFTPRSTLTSSRWADDDYPELLEIHQNQSSNTDVNEETVLSESTNATKLSFAKPPNPIVFENRNISDDVCGAISDVADERSEKGDELEWENDTPLASHNSEQTAEWNLASSELAEERRWKNVTIGGAEYRIDSSAVEPYRKVVAHGGYYGDGLNAVIVFSACYLPSRKESNYHYLMDNLFLYTVSVLDALVAEDYIIIFFHGGATSDQMPTFSWLRKCYRLIDSRHVSFTEPGLDRRLRKNLKRLLLVHATLWLKTVITMTKPFISSKFSKKITFIQSLDELSTVIPLDQVAIPEQILSYDKNKASNRRKVVSSQT